MARITNACASFMCTPITHHNFYSRRHAQVYVKGVLEGPVIPTYVGIYYRTFRPCDVHLQHEPAESSSRHIGSRHIFSIARADHVYHKMPVAARARSPCASYNTLFVVPIFLNGAILTNCTILKYVAASASYDTHGPLARWRRSGGSRSGGSQIWREHTRRLSACLRDKCKCHGRNVR